MSYGKDAYINAHDELIDEYLERHPEADLDTAQKVTEDQVWERYQDNLADAIDRTNDERKEFRI